MAAPRNPLGKAKLEGRDKKDPQRFKKRKEPVVKDNIGLAPKWMNTDQKAVWKQFATELPWLNASHVSLLEIATTIRTRVISGEEVGVQALNLLRQCLGQMGATPSEAVTKPKPSNKRRASKGEVTNGTMES